MIWGQTSGDDARVWLVIVGTLVDGGPRDRCAAGTIQQHGAPGALDVPPVFALFTGTPESYGPYGGKGLGEVPIVPVAPAVANALARATGKRFSQLPPRPDEVWRCFHERNEESSLK